ncbi:MAG: hypothetical protein AAGB15_10595, partial [Pseudomonadota bacterium]
AATPAKTTMALCRNAAIKAADRYGVPRSVMLAIALVETRTTRSGATGAWPWTVNVAGKGAWFDSRAAALIHAQQALAKGQTSFDVGCFQLNYRWHGKHFQSIDHMFEPGPSGAYAARFLKGLHAETGDWIKAAGFYHSRTARHAKRYRTLVSRTIAAMGGRVPQAVAVADAAKKKPVQRVYRVTTNGGLYPVEPSGQIRTPSDANAGSVGTVVLRRSQGGLIRVGRGQGDG